MIAAVLIFNTLGKARLSKFYTPSPPSNRAKLLSSVFDIISTRPDNVCNFVELPKDFLSDAPTEASVESEDLRIIYRHYATLYFVFIVDSSESELGILDLIQVFVESLDRCFENVCELDLIFHFDDVHALLSCIITGGLVLDTSTESIALSFANQSKAKKLSATSSIGGINLGLGGLQKGLADVGLDRFGGLLGNGFRRG